MLQAVFERQQAWTVGRLRSACVRPPHVFLRFLRLQWCQRCDHWPTDRGA